MLSLPSPSWGINEQDEYFFLHFISEKTEAQLSNLCSHRATASVPLCLFSFFASNIPVLPSIMQPESQRLTEPLALLQGPSLPEGTKSSLSPKTMAEMRIFFV